MARHTISSLACATLLALSPAARAALPAITMATGPDQRPHFVTATGQVFVPQGVNWVAVSPGTPVTQKNISFNPDYYPAHRDAIHQSLRAMAKDGYNFVRIRLDAEAIAGPAGTVALDRAYMDNVIDFIRAAADSGLYVEPTGQWLPTNYYGLVSRDGFPDPDRRNTSGINELLLSRGLTHAYGRYVADFLAGIKDADPQLLSAIFCVDLWNELGFESKDLPFSRETGRYTAEDGSVIDLADPASRQRLADAAATRWIDGVIAEAKTVAPSTLFTSSVFSPLDVYRSGYIGVYMADAKWGDPRQPFRLSAIESSKADFLEIHLYPHASGATLDAQMASLEYAPDRMRKPVVLAETGAFKGEIATVDQVATTLRSILRQSCALRFAGWAYWTWDTDNQTDLWNLQEAGGYLARRLAPKSFDWCGG
ncbi:hypothetical protein FBZ89_110159 [Nitrospirillum amazonense]|uniref:Cellulase (Glycosyl hydrolase family 5) n=1 Tax=Nitrospirillum amazonense TaxID=28077 RepID=A0A560FA84_9PROT|nr:glycoside hydrolase family 5 protein [Nitrospirillum amazonense]TWB18510.1 hypothetical protein FBZ89_110159 [Nitrospirillum amazonense]